jgi:transcriptional regulator with XRE-family HTH domain
MAHGARPSEVFRDQLRGVRERKRWTQLELARVLTEDLGEETHQATITKIEKGTRGVSLDDALRLAAVLDVSPLNMVVPRGAEPEVLLAPELAVTPRRMRQWVRGQRPLRKEGERFYFSEVSDEEWLAQHKHGIGHVLRLAQQLVDAVVDEDRDQAADVIDALHVELERQRDLQHLRRRMSTREEVREFFSGPGTGIKFSPRSEDEAEDQGTPGDKRDRTEGDAT